MNAVAAKLTNGNISIKLNAETVIAILQQLDDAEKTKIWEYLQAAFVEDIQPKASTHTFSLPRVTAKDIERWKAEDLEEIKKGKEELTDLELLKEMKKFKNR